MQILASLRRMLTWLQEYSERLGIADVPTPNPPLDNIQQDLIEAYAAQSRSTWEGMTTNLHIAEVQRLGSSEEARVQRTGRKVHNGPKVPQLG